MTPPPQVSEALVLANLCSTVADALKKAALDLRMIDSRDRERKHERVREVMEKAKQMALVEVARQHGLTSAPIRDEPDDTPTGYIYCRNCGQRIRADTTTAWHIERETVTCPGCGLDAQRSVDRQRPTVEVGFAVVACSGCGALRRHRNTCWRCGGTAIRETVPAQCRCCGAISYESVCPDCGGTAWVPAGTAERDLPESAIWWFGGR